MALNAEERLKMSQSIANQIEERISILSEQSDRRLIVAFLSGWFEGALKGDSL